MALKNFLQLTCMEHAPTPNVPRPFVDAAFLYSEYCQWSRLNLEPPSDKKDFVEILEKNFPHSSLVKIGPHPHFLGISYKQWRPKKT